MPMPDLSQRARSHLRYASYVARHKWFVFRAGLKTRAPFWRLLIHDWSKLSRAEWTPYVHSFYRSDVPREHKQAAFDAAWLHHQHRNPHHWQHWLLQEDDGALKKLPMPDHFIREMVADWMGAGRAITGKWEVVEWYRKNATRIKLEAGTRDRVHELLGIPPVHTFDLPPDLALRGQSVS
jgi:hypothetical protein